MNVAYIDFWGGLDPSNNWFNYAVSDALDGKSLYFGSSAEDADIIFMSCFGDQKKNCKNAKAKKILYLGENQRPDYSFANYSLSFDFDNYEGKNFRLPHWYLYVNWWNDHNCPNTRISIEELFHQYTSKEIKNRSEFCSIVINNPVKNRLDVTKILNTYKSVHKYGRAFHNYYSQDKLDLLKKYRYNICFENSITDGYVTEKLLQAKVAGCIPIYYGHPSVKEDFNPNCFINFYEYKNSRELLSKIVEIENDSSKFKSIVSEPLFCKKPNLDGLCKFLKKVLK